MEYAIEIEGLVKKYAGFPGFRQFLKHPFKKNETPALNGINLKVKKGEVFGLLGQNGAGKTTLIKVLSTLLLADNGRVLVNGCDVVRQEEDVKKSIGLVNSEARSFFWRLTGEENLKFFGRLHGFEGLVLEQRIKQVLESVKLRLAGNKMYFTYSSGMKQRLCIARSLLNDPKLLLLDEPTLGLDPNISLELQKFFKEIIQKKQKKTVFLATHDLNEAKMLCDRIAIIHRGKIAAVKSAGDFNSISKLKNFFKKTTVN